MASITWPATLPAPDAPANEMPPNTAIRTKMNGGPDKVRRRYTSAPRVFSLSYTLTQMQTATLDTFFVTTSKCGTITMNWTNPRTGAACEARIIECSYTADEGMRVTASLKIEVLL